MIVLVFCVGPMTVFRGSRGPDRTFRGLHRGFGFWKAGDRNQWSLNPFSTAEDGVDTGKHEFQSPARDLANAISEDLPVQSDSKRDIRDGILR
jgi:hypothetical protein